MIEGSVARVKVWNDNVYDYTEKFQDEMVTIKAKGFVVMDREKAILFKGTFSEILRDKGGVPLPQSFKKIRLEAITTDKPVVVPEVINCQACNESFKSVKALNKHIKENHMDLIVDKESKEDAEKELNDE